MSAKNVLTFGSRRIILLLNRVGKGPGEDISGAADAQSDKERQWKYERETWKSFDQQRQYFSDY